MLDFLSAIINAVENSSKIKAGSATIKNVSLIESGKNVTRIIEDEAGALRSTISQYSSSNYFHVGPRRHMFGVIAKLIGQANLLRTKIGPISI